MKTKLLCTLANKDDTRFAHVNDPASTFRLRGLDLHPGAEPLPEFTVGDVYVLEVVITKVGS